MSILWWKVDQDVLDLAQELIEKHHPDLKGARIGFLFREKAPVSNGRQTLGRASKVSSKWRALLGMDGEALDFVIWLAHETWEDLRQSQRRALLDHELQHCFLEYGEPKMRGHDLEEFAVIVERHGLWNYALEQMANAIEEAEQLQIPFEELARETTVKAVGPQRRIFDDLRENLSDEVANELAEVGLEVLDDRGH